MKYSTLCLSTIMALTTCSGLAISGNAAPSAEYPVGIAQFTEYDVHEVAKRLFKLMPETDKVLIAQAGGIGSEGFDLSGFTTNIADSEPLDVPEGMIASEYLELIVSDELAARMTAVQRDRLDTIAAELDAGKVLPMLCFTPDTDMEYVFAVNQLLEFPLRTRFQQTGRWSSTATNGGGLSQGEPVTLTYSYVPDGTTIPNAGIGLGSGDSSLFAWLNGIYGSPATWQAIFDRVFDRWSELIGVDYVYEPNDDGSSTNGASGQLGVRGDVRIGAFDFQNDGNSGVLAYNFFPNDGDMIFDSFDTFYNSTGGQSLRLRNVIAHEHGHGLGMLHVCPIEESKLMEPFVSTNFDGPQLDDILNGIRHYGDVFEPNNSIAQATDMGSFNVGDISNLENLGVDDNSDRDFFRLTINERARILFTVAPTADEYLQGEQTQNCNGGSLTDYNRIQDLQITAVLPNGTTIQIEDSTGFAGTESMVFDAETPGDYYFIVEGTTNANNVQRYRTSAIVSAVPFLVPVISADAPTSLDPGVPNSFSVTVDPREDTIVGGSEMINYSINGAPFASSPLVDNGGNNYTATIPAVNCGDSVEYYISLDGNTANEVTFPEEGEAAAMSAFVGELITSFADDFESNLGWNVSGDVNGQNSGEWERGAPQGDGSRGDTPVDADGSGSCYSTGNGGANSNTDVDGGATILTSPVFDLSNNPEAQISYYRWFHNSFGANPNVEIFQVEISDTIGGSWVDLETVAGNSPESNGGWFQKSFRVADFVNTTNQVRVRFIAEDNSGSVVEAAVDGVEIVGQTCEDPETCAADLTGDGVLDFFDVSAFLDAFGAQEPSADFTNDSTYDFFDVSEFLDQFGAGCP